VNKHDFLNELEKQLGNIAKDDKREILYDYEEHFRMGVSEGKTEEEVARSLGDPKTIARQFRADSALSHAQPPTSAGNIFRAVFAAGLLGFFNLVFVLIPFICVVAILFSFSAVAFCIALGGILLFAVSLLSPFFPEAIDVGSNFLFASSLSVAVTCFGLLFLIGMCYAVKYFFRWTISYLRWNFDFIKR